MEYLLPNCWNCKFEVISSFCASFIIDFFNSFSPRKIMLFGMITQVFCGCITGLVNDFSLHIFFRYLSAVCCAQMYTAGSMICKTNLQLFFISRLIFFLNSNTVFLFSSLVIYFLFQFQF